MDYQMDIGSRLLSAETHAARVEGILLADPALAGLWRMETSLLEAAASVGLEGERISTQGMVLRLTSGTAVEEDARAVEMALKLLTVIRRPGDPFGAPVAALRRIEAASAPIGQTRDEGDRLEDAELPLVVEAGRTWSHVPILAGWRAAASYAFRSRRSSPVAERLVFMAVEGAARHLQGLSPDQRAGRDEVDETAGGLLMPATAGWIVPPSVSLTRNGFRVWSPMTGLATFLEAATRSLSHDLGHLGTLRHELARLTAMTSSAHGRSRLVDLITYLKAQPVISSAMVMDHLGVTRRTALSLIGELVEAGCLSNLTARGTSRFWALPSLAARMGHAGGAGAIRGGIFADREGPRGHLKPSGQLDRLREERDEGQLDRIMANLDTAMSGVDDVVRRAGGPRPREK
ncbi:helix-turn-helix domain-containing protein [Paracoccus sp. PAMC 22219]|uniref:helix-turn-helix domain-containing protein n=1 Tax=Paracoccus sp. PAMC 22219 TaxID=1569209 RepID=UPI0018CE6F4A|nr:helix-turn-helix domain-containing protein [Paracoccus sp. PAMC 22219]